MMALFAGMLTQLPSVAMAASNNQDSQFNNPIGAGISNPSYYTALYGQNPAGLGYSNTGRIKLAPIWSMQTIGGSHTLNGDVIYGNTFVAVGAGLSYIAPILAGATSSLGARAGVAVTTRVLALGGFASLGISPATSPSFKLGALLMPNSPVRIGYTLHGLGGSSVSHSAGAAFDLGRAVTIVADAGVDGAFQRIVLAPGIGISAQKLKISGGYGFQLTQVGSFPAAPLTGFYGSLTGEVSKKLLVFANYQTINALAAGLIITL